MPGATITVGNVEITAVHDNEGALPLSMVFPGVDAELWVPYQEKYPECFKGDNNEIFAAHFDCYVIRSEGRTILVDTGVGSMATNPGSVTAFAGGVDGRLLLDIQEAGVNKDDIDTVFFTHLHPDHVGWNINNDGPSPRSEEHTSELQSLVNLVCRLRLEKKEQKYNLTQYGAESHTLDHTHI